MEKDLKRLGLSKNKAKEMIYRISVISDNDEAKFSSLIKCYKEVLRLGYLSNEEYTELIDLGLNISKVISEIMEVAEDRIIQDIEERKLNHIHVEFVIRSITSEK